MDAFFFGVDDLCWLASTRVILGKVTFVSFSPPSTLGTTFAYYPFSFLKIALN